MLNFETQILSKEIIKPSSPEIYKKEPFKICLFDQLIPTTYGPIIAFYALSDDTNILNVLTRLKKSLSETLNILYPLSGRIHDNMFIHDFDAGVPFTFARIGVRLSEFLKHNQLESLNKLLPCQPFTKETNDRVPLLLCQVTVFACGGIALGLCGSHKIIDGKTGTILTGLWSKICRGSHHGIQFPGLSNASVVFPPRNPMPKNYITLIENLWFTEANYVTKKFVFNAKAIATLRDMAKWEAERIPTRVEAVSGFIWQRSMAASREIRGAMAPSILVQAVDMRPRGMAATLDGSIGNVFWWGSAASHPAETDTKLSNLVEWMSQSIAVFHEEYLSSVQGEEGFEVFSEHLNQLETIFSSDEKPDVFAFTSLLKNDFNKLDFGWGEPYSFSMFGKVGPEFRNLTVLLGTKDGKGIEALITLDEMRMSALEKDPEFLRFASPNLNISSL